MVSVLLTVDTELQFQSGSHRDSDMEANYRANVLGHTDEGIFGLDFQLELLGKFGLRAVFFVEALHALVIGPEFLQRTVQRIHAANQEIQLHVHVEWLHRLKSGQFGRPRGDFMRDYSLDQQSALIHSGLDLLANAGAPNVSAFRAGSFGANDATLEAVGRNSLAYDSSYNAVYDGGVCRIETGRTLALPRPVGSITEIPVTVFRSPPLGLRHAAIGACSFAELKAMLDSAYDAGLPLFVLLSHSFELLTSNRRRVNPIVAKRFQLLCQYLNASRDRFSTVGFTEVSADVSRMGDRREPQLVSRPLATGLRVFEQLIGRLYEWPF